MKNNRKSSDSYESLPSRVGRRRGKRVTRESEGEHAHENSYWAHIT